MEKNSRASKSPKRNATAKIRQSDRLTIGMDLGDKTSRYCVLNGAGEVLEQGACPTTRKGMTQFGSRARSRIAIEVGTHSPWVSRELKKYGHEVIVANARQVKLISESSRKNDKLDAQMLARLARVDPALLRPIRHRSEGAKGPADDSGSGGAGGGADETGQRSAWAGQGNGRTAGVVRYGPDGNGEAGGIAGGSGRNAEAFGGTGGIADGKDQGV